MANFLERWKPYNFLWKNERSIRDLLQISLAQFENILRKHGELEDKLVTEPDIIILGKSIAVSTDKLRYALQTEIKSTINNNIISRCNNQKHAYTVV
jgi:dynein heavy chain